MVGLHLPPAHRDELLARTEGWMTGLRLAALRAARGKQAASISRITGDEPAVADYLWDEVLASLPPDSRLFLLRTSVADGSAAIWPTR
jgi:LuxR family maltose regulon positive regulatory protein